MNSRESGLRLLAMYRALGDEEVFTESETALLFKLLRYMNDSYESFPGQELLMRKLKVTKKTLISQLNSLQGKGAITIAKKHGKSGCTVYKILWAEKVISEMSPTPAKKAGKQHQPFSHHEPEDTAESRTVVKVDDQFYYDTQEQSTYNDQWYEEVAFDIEEEGASSPSPLPSEEEKEQIFQQWFQERQASHNVTLRPNMFTSRALAHHCKPEEVDHYYTLYLKQHEIMPELKIGKG